MIEILNRFARLASSRSEVVGASLIILMIVMMVMPLSPALLDVLLAFNISISILLVISAVMIESPLSFSSFPALLLMTTLFRLSLTISTTRQILLEADAGKIVQTFGEFVVGGNVAVGLVIFLIISVVNFLVVTKGSERVAEVAARFSLDGMPGKQMSIDGDLRAGLITQAQAKKRRSDLEKESQLFGAMDGAIKFVKNDAIAGLVITAVNLLGGLTVGMLQKGMDFSTASSTYVILSVGDGLIGIIPSLMVSIAAGLIVTRVTKGEADGSSTAADMFRDLSRNTNALQISAMFCFVFAFVPGMPTTVFLSISAAFLFAWYSGTGAEAKTEAAANSEQFAQLISDSQSAKMDDLVITSTYAPLDVRIPVDAEPNVAQLIQNMCKLSRNRQVDHLGILLPLVEFSRHKLGTVEFLIFGVPVYSINLSDKRLVALCDPQRLSDLEQIQFEVEKDPLSGKYEVLCDPIYKLQLDQANIPTITYENRIVRQIECLLVRKVEQFFTLNEYQKHIGNLNEKFGEQFKELERVLPATKVVSILQALMVESVSIKNLRSILNSLIEWGQRERDPVVIGEQVRRVLFEQICHQHSHERKLRLLMLDSEFEQVLRESIRSTGTGTFLDIDASSLSDMVRIVEEQVKPHCFSEYPPVIVCSIDCRYYFRQMIQDALFCVPVLSHQEIASSMQIQVLGNITLDQPSGQFHPDFAGLTS